MTHRKHLIFLLPVLFLSACGGGSSTTTPTNNSPPENPHPTPNPTSSFFSKTPDLVFDNIEGSRQLDFCPFGLRDDVRVFDFNQDSRPDIISTFRCFENVWPKHGTVHNEDHRSAWVIWLGQEDGSFVESTQALVGTNYIDITDGATGGIPAGAEGIKRQDINKDGFPDIFYSQNRDDVRPPDVEGIFDPNPIFTWRSQQSVLMSNADGTYGVQFIGVPLYIGTASMIPNNINSYDFLALGYGESMVYRFIDGSWVDVESEWSARPIWNNLINGSVYFNFLNLDSSDNNPLSAAAPPANILVQDGTSPEHAPLQTNGQRPAGATLYSFTENGGEYLDSWIYESEQYTYKQPCSTCTDGINPAPAFEWNGESTFGMAWETQHSVTLYKDEPPVLVLQALGFALKNKYKNNAFDPNLTYAAGGEDDSLPDSQQIIPAHLLKVLRLENGKIVDRDPNPIDENIIRDSSYFYNFVDLNNDGYDDLFIQSHGKLNPLVYINNQQGKLKRINDSVFPVSDISSGMITVPNGSETLSLPLNSSGALRDVNGDGLYDLVVWHVGNKPFEGDTVVEAQKWQSGRIEVYYAQKPLILEGLEMSSQEIFAEETERGF